MYSNIVCRRGSVEKRNSFSLSAFFEELVADLFEPIVRPIGKGDELRWEPHGIGQSNLSIGRMGR